MINDNFAKQFVIHAEKFALTLDARDGKVDNKTTVKFFNDFAEEHGLQKIEGREDTEPIDVQIAKEQMIQSFCEKYPDKADEINAYLNAKQFEDLTQEDVKPSEPQFGL